MASNYLNIKLFLFTSAGAIISLLPTTPDFYNILLFRSPRSLCYDGYVGVIYLPWAQPGPKNEQGLPMEFVTFIIGGFCVGLN